MAVNASPQFVCFYYVQMYYICIDGTEAAHYNWRKGTNMKKLVFVTILFNLLSHAFCADYSLLGGFETAFGLRWSTSLKTELGGRDYSDTLKVKENNFIIAPGFNIILRRSDAENNKESMFKLRFLFLSKLDTEISASLSGISAGTKISNVYSDFDNAFFIDISSGKTFKITISEKIKLLIDLGPALNFTYVDGGFVTEKIFGFGGMVNAGFGFALTRHLTLETGLNTELLLTLGSRTEPGLSVFGIGFMMPITPYISFGYKF